MWHFKYLVIFIDICFITKIETQKPCASPSFYPAICIEFKDCKVYYEEFVSKKGNITKDLRNLIDESWCGIQNFRHFICCPVTDLKNENKLINVAKTTERTSSIPTIVMDNLRGSIGTLDLDTINRDHDDEEFDDFQNHHNIRLIPQQDCGNDNSDRILNGNLTEPFQYPWMVIVQIIQKNKLLQVCGGTLITEKFVLTAAHCISFPDLGTRVDSVILGEQNRQTDIDCTIDGDCADPIVIIPVQKAIPHPQFSRSSATNDIGLLRLLAIIEFNDSIQPICLPLTSYLQNFSLSKILITGWGITEKGSQSDVLLQALIPVTDNDSCELRSARILLAPSHLCAGGNMSDSCRGDSGGPAIYPADTLKGRRFVQFGIVSAGNDCDKTATTNGLYTRVSSYVKWILDTIY